MLSAKRLRVAGTGVFWPTLDDELSRLTGTFDGNGFPTSDHRLIWLDVIR